MICSAVYATYVSLVLLKKMNTHLSKKYKPTLKSVRFKLIYIFFVQVSCSLHVKVAGMKRNPYNLIPKSNQHFVRPSDT